MTKLQAKFSKLIKAVTENEQEVHTHLNEVTTAQNRGGVLIMTLLQLLLEKEIVSKEELAERFEQNQKAVLDEDGGCKIPLSSLLDKGVECHEEKSPGVQAED